MKWRTKNLETDLVIPEGYVVDIWMDGPSRQNSFIQRDECPYIAGRGGFHIGRTPTCTPRPVKRIFLGAATLTIEPDVRGVQSYFHNYMSMSDQTGEKNEESYSQERNVDSRDLDGSHDGRERRREEFKMAVVEFE